jgi:folylpolyglutamate synthase
LNKYRDSTGKFSRVGLFTSPHLTQVRERIAINGQAIPEDRFAYYFFQLWSALYGDEIAANIQPALRLGYFPFLTLLSFYIFVREDVDIAVYETGVGGEYDVTNIIERPVAAGITALGIDHVTKLGGTLEEIAWHKAGIFKQNCPALSVLQPTGALQVLQQRAEAKKAVFRCILLDPRLRDVKIYPDERYQRDNASLAIALSEKALTRFSIHPSSNALSMEIRDGIQEAVLPGRAQVIHEPKMTWYFDCAHTPESLEVATNWFLATSTKG